MQTNDLSMFKSPEFRGGLSKLPGCQLLNDKSKPGLFITDDNLKLCGWFGQETGGGVKYEHTYNDGVDKPGLHFASPRILVINSSPRLVELTKKGQEFGAGRKGDIIGNFETFQGKAARESMPKECTTLRTLHLLYIVDEFNSLLHKVPLVLSVHGAAAAFFGEALDNFYRKLDIAYSEHVDPNGGYYPLGEKPRAIAVFQPTFTKEMVGEKEKSAVCSVKSFVEPVPETVESLFAMTAKDRVWSTQESLAGFADRYLKQFQEYHSIAPGVATVDVRALPVGRVLDDNLEDPIDF